MSGCSETRVSFEREIQLNRDVVEIINAYVTRDGLDASDNFQNMLGVNFDATTACGCCLRQVNGERAIESRDNVRSIFEKCRGANGCAVCAVCGFALLHTITDAVEHARGVPPCPKCGAVLFIAASKFRDRGAEIVSEVAAHVRERERSLRCIELFGAVAGVTAFAKRASGKPLNEEQVLDILRVALDATGPTECDLYVNRFFDRLEQTMAFGDWLEDEHSSAIGLVSV
jgi:hypothetical protein